MNSFVRKLTGRNISFLGVPGVGKSTYISALLRMLNDGETSIFPNKYSKVDISTNQSVFLPLSTGNLLRKEVRDMTEAGRKIKHNMSQGLLVDQDILASVIIRNMNLMAIESKGIECRDVDLSVYNPSLYTNMTYFIDGFPRDEGQIMLAERHSIVIDRVMLFKQNEELIFHKLRNRKVCPLCGMAYNYSNSGEHIQVELHFRQCWREIRPKHEDNCDSCNSPLVSRIDDDIEVIKRRIKQFNSDITKIQKCYSSKVIEFNINKGIHDGFSEFIELLDSAL